MKFNKFFYILSLAFSLSSCAKKEEEKSIVPNQEKKTSEQGAPEEETIAQEFLPEHILEASEKILQRFQVLSSKNVKLQKIKSWKTSKYIYSHLSYFDNDAAKEENIYSACHFHGTSLGCHKARTIGPEEPKELPQQDL